MNAERLEDAGRAVDEAALESAFRRIHDERMHGLPFLNEALQVQAIDFQDWSGLRLGALVTPWSINLVLLPGRGRALPATRPGDECLHAFPAGVFGFQPHDDPFVGSYQQCSLFSPATEFGSQADAVAAARAALGALLAPVRTEATAQTMSRRSLFGGS